MGKLISFSSGKGGVGKTSVVSNLGLLAAGRGRRTLLIDGDWTLGKLGISLGVRPKYTVGDVLDGKVDLMDAIHPVRENLFLLGAPSGKVGFEQLEEESRQQLYYELMSLDDHFDEVLFDLASGSGWGVLQFAASSHQQVIVTNPEPTSYTDAYAIMKLLSRRFGIRQFHLLVTLSDNLHQSEGIISRFLDVVYGHLNVSVNVLDILPRVGVFGDTARRQQAFVECYPTSDFAKKLTKVAKALESAPERRDHGLQLFNRLEAPGIEHVQANQILQEHSKNR